MGSDEDCVDTATTCAGFEHLCQTWDSYREQCRETCGLCGCNDTPAWTDGDGSKCQDYREHACENGGIKPGEETFFGIKHNYPENNCCGCGKKIEDYNVTEGACRTGDDEYKMDGFPCEAGTMKNLAQCKRKCNSLEKCRAVSWNGYICCGVTEKKTTTKETAWQCFSKPEELKLTKENSSSVETNFL